MQANWRANALGGQAVGLGFSSQRVREGGSEGEQRGRATTEAWSRHPLISLCISLFACYTSLYFTCLCGDEETRLTYFPGPGGRTRSRSKGGEREARQRDETARRKTLDFLAFTPPPPFCPAAHLSSVCFSSLSGASVQGAVLHCALSSTRRAQRDTFWRATWLG